MDAVDLNSVDLKAVDLDAVDLDAVYPWPAEARWLRAMMVMTVDGATAGGDGRSRSISSVADRQVMAAVRRLSDVVLIGAGTFRAERYGPMRARAEDAAERAALGLAPAPVLAIVSSSLDLPWAEPAFSESAVRPVVLTGSAADPAALQVAQQHADVVVLPGARVDLTAALDRLAERGLRRVVCEGGATLLATVARSDLLDEADLTIAPLFTFGGQVQTGSASPNPVRLTLAHALTGPEGFLFTRYVRAESSRGS